MTGTLYEPDYTYARPTAAAAVRSAGLPIGFGLIFLDWCRLFFDYSARSLFGRTWFSFQGLEFDTYTLAVISLCVSLVVAASHAPAELSRNSYDTDLRRTYVLVALFQTAMALILIGDRGLIAGIVGDFLFLPMPGDSSMVDWLMIASASSLILATSGMRPRRY